MMLGWYRKAVKRLGHEPISFEQLTAPGARGHEKPVIGVSLRGSAKMGKALIDDVRHRRGSFVSNFAQRLRRRGPPVVELSPMQVAKTISNESN